MHGGPAPVGAGVGVLLNPSLGPFVARSLARLDHLAAIPDRGWIDHGGPAATRFEKVPGAMAALDAAAGERPVALHGIGLSIGSAEHFDQDYADHLLALAGRLGSPWVSEHLAFSRAGTGHEADAALLVGLPYDREALEMLVPRARFFTERLDGPFLLENNVNYLRYLEQDLSEETFLNELCRRSGCGLLLDLHNVHTNAVNHGFDAAHFVDRLDLNRVVEIHVAGGVAMMGFHTDSHTGPVLEPVWDLLEHTLPKARRLRGITFEFHESSFRLLGETGLWRQLDRARAILDHHGPKP